MGPSYMENWFFGVQRAVTSTTVAEVDYIGSVGRHLYAKYNVNRFAGDLIQNGGNFTGLAPGFGAINYGQASESSGYNGFTASVRQRASHGVTLNAAYTFSKAMTNTTAYNDQRELDLDWARTGFDRTQRLISNFTYDLPEFGSNAVLQGWSISGIVILQSGLPMSLIDRNGGGVYGFAAPATVTLCPGATYKDMATPGGTTARLDNWINKSAICKAPVIGSDGSTGYGNTGQGIMEGPGQFNTDFSFGKATSVGGLRENAQLAFRVEFYNALNHPPFANPGTNLGTANFGVISKTSVAPRLIQFGLKYIF